MASFLSLSAWSLDREDSKFGPSSRWSNKDMDPVPEDCRTWSTWDYIAYWISDAANPTTWQMASSMLAVGLSWRQALSAIAVGNVIIAVSKFLVHNSL
jgi:cytosine/uracil/thiamine/allantoin permease